MTEVFCVEDMCVHASLVLLLLFVLVCRCVGLCVCCVVGYGMVLVGVWCIMSTYWCRVSVHCYIFLCL